MAIQQRSSTILALTAGGAELARRLAEKLPESQLILPAKLARMGESSFAQGQFTATFDAAFRQSNCLICIMATGIVVRKLAAVIVDKTSDPAVLVIDEQANHVISLLSGHVGRANELTRKIAKQLHADPVITTATDTEHVAAIDTLAQAVHGWYPDFKYQTKRLNLRLAQHEPVEIWIDPDFRELKLNLTGLTVLDQVADRHPNTPLVLISDKTTYPKLPDSLQIIPRVNALGVGCRQAVTYQMMETAFSDFCQERHLAWRSFYQIASIEKKQHENAIHYLAGVLQVPVTFYSAAALRTVSNHYPESAFVRKTVGVGNVANSAAELAAGTQTIGPRFSKAEITMAVSRQRLERN